MLPTIRQIEVFHALAQERSFRKAAEILHTSQPALSRSIKDLEEIVGALLFTRTTRSVELTPAGKVFEEGIGSVVDTIQRSIAATQSVARGETGEIAIGYMDFAIIGPLPSILNGYRNARPNVKIALSYLPTQDQIPLLLQNKIDVGFVSGSPQLKGFDKKMILSEGLVVVLPDGHKFAERKSLSLHELKDEYFVAGDAQWEIYTERIRHLCHKNGFTPNIVQTAFHRDAILGFVLAGIGVALYPECVRNVRRPGLKYIDVQNVGKTFGVTAIWQKNPSVVVQSLLDQIHSGNTYQNDHQTISN